jgi:prevent-host-death family protein
MTRRVSATEAKNRLGELLRVVSHEGETVVVENRREPTAVIVSFADYQELQTLREAKRRQDAVAELRQIAERQAERNKDLTEEEIEAIADQASKDVMESLVRKGKIRFEE